jgi:hypothetical protein
MGVECCLDRRRTLTPALSREERGPVTCVGRSARPSPQPSPRGRGSQFSRDVAVHRAMDLAGNSGTCFHQPSLPVVTMGRSTVGAGPCEIGDQERLGAGRVETAAAAFPAQPLAAFSDGSLPRGARYDSESVPEGRLDGCRVGAIDQRKALGNGGLHPPYECGHRFFCNGLSFTNQLRLSDPGAGSSPPPDPIAGWSRRLQPVRPGLL